MDKQQSIIDATNSKSNKSSKSILLNDNRSSDGDKSSLQSLVCRICFDDGREEPIITPCHCKGTVAYVHKTCLEKWLSESNTTSCELCHHVYETERIPKYTANQSIWHWIWYQPDNVGFQVRRLRGDLLACGILTPIAILVTYVCLFSADYYNQQKFSNIPVAKWTSISLLLMIALLLFGYYLWVYVVVGYHGRTWYYWWQRECVVRYIPPISNSCCEIPPRINQTNMIEHVPTQEIEINEAAHHADTVVIYVNAENDISQSSSENLETPTINDVVIDVTLKNEEANVDAARIEANVTNFVDSTSMDAKSENMNNDENSE